MSLASLPHLPVVGCYMCIDTYLLLFSSSFAATFAIDVLHPHVAIVLSSSLVIAIYFISHYQSNGMCLSSKTSLSAASIMSAVKHSVTGKTHVVAVHKQ